MKIIRIIFLALFYSLALMNCKKESTTTEAEHSENASKPEKEEEEHHEEEMQSIVSLTEEQIKTVGITLQEMEMKELTSTIKANGILRVPNNNKATITSLYGGIIQSLKIQVGSYVRKGQVIATISNPEYVQLQEQYLMVNSRITYAQQEYRRQQELFDNNAGAKKNLQSASAELRSLQNQKASLHKQLRLMGINPASVSNSNLKSGLVVTSPISGTVSNVNAQIGSYVDISSPIADVINNSSLHLDLQVFEKDLPKLSVGQIVHFNLTNNPESEYDARVFSIGSSFENDSKTVSVHCNVTGSKEGLIDGMNITGLVSLNNILTPAVPNDAIVESEGKYFVFIQTEKESEDHAEEENHSHEEGEEHGEEENTSHEKTINFEKIEVIKGTSEMGYTAITPVSEIPEHSKIVVKGAFFVNAKLSGSSGHSH